MDDHLRKDAEERKYQNDSQYHLDQELCYEESEWEQFEYAESQPNETVSGIIVAHLPDLGESDSAISDRGGETKFFLLSYGKKCFSGIVPAFTKPARQLRKTFRSSNKSFYSKLILIGVVLLICGVVLTVGTSKKRKKNSQEVTQTPAVQKAEPAPAVKNNQKAVSEQKENEAKAKAAAELAAKEKTDKEAAEKAVKAKAAAEQAAKDKVAAEQAAKVKAAAELAAKEKADKEAAEKEKNLKSPWERPISSDYSPWTMNSAQRMDAAAINTAQQESEQAGVAISVPTNPSTNLPTNTPTNSPALAPMNPIPQIQAATVVPQQPYAAVAGPMTSGNIYPQAPVQQTNPNYPAPAANIQMQGGFASSSQFNRGPQTAPISQPYANNMAATPMPIARSTVPAAGRIPISETTKSYQGHYNQYQSQYPNQYQYQNQYQATPTAAPYVASLPMHPQPTQASQQPYIPAPRPTYPMPTGQAPQANAYQQNTYQYQSTNYYVPNPSAAQQTAPQQQPVQQPVPNAYHQYQQQPSLNAPLNAPVVGGTYPQSPAIPSTPSRIY